MFASEFINTFLIGIALLIGLSYIYFKRKHSYWKRKNVYTLPPVIPFGNAKDFILRKVNFGEVFRKAYEETKGHPVVGMYTFHSPTLMINDLDLIKTILTKDFQHFSEHGFPSDEERDPLNGHLFNLGGSKWKNLRVKLTPTFTSSKMRMMFDVIASCAGEMSDHLEDMLAEKDIEDIKELMSTFANDVIANCAFGIECNSFKNPNDKFKQMGRRIFQASSREILISILDLILPAVTKALKIKTISPDVEDFFYNIFAETVKYREDNKIFRNDFMQLLIQLKNDGFVGDEDIKQENVTDDVPRLTMMQLAAQVFVFFVAGYDTTSSTISFALYELALNLHIQKKLIEEIDQTLEKHQGKITYDSLSEMTYLTYVIEETLRKHPPLPMLPRICTKKYIIPDTGILIEKGTSVVIPIHGIHQDPNHFPNPEEFNPERFNPENKQARHRFSYLPFGEGPRICIGNRFGMVQSKLGLATFLSKFEVEICERTLIPMVYDRNSLILTADGGLWLRIKKRNK